MNQEDQTSLISSFSEYTSEQKVAIKTALIQAGLRQDVTVDAALVDIESKAKATVYSARYPSLYQGEAIDRLDRFRMAIEEALVAYANLDEMMKGCVDAQINVAMLMVNQPGVLLPHESPIAEKLLGSRFEWAMETVRTAASLAAGPICQTVYPQGTGRRANDSLDKMIRFLCSVFHDLTGKRPARGWIEASGKTTGPFTRFVRAVLIPTGLADDYLDHAIRKNCEEYKSLLERWQSES